jgi:hypothetical protein
MTGYLNEAAVCIGPELVKEAVRETGFDLLLVCGFASLRE